MAGARFVVSDSGDILSPKYAPEMIAPTVMPSGMPRPCPTPTRATPMVPMVVQELPVKVDTMVHSRQDASRKTFGEIQESP